MAALRDALRGREPPPLPSVAARASYRWFVVGTVCIGSFIGQVDASMTQMLLPRLEADFSARLSTVSWVAVAYLLAMASFMPIFGRLADMLGRKLLYTGGFLLFVLGSALCGFAEDLPTLIGFRVLQGIGAALLTANSIAIVVTAAGPEARGRALGLQSAAQAIGLGIGPAVGGLILDTLGWHWMFWINVPFGLVGALLGWLVIPQTTKPEPSRFDWSGALLIGPALTAVIALLNQGYDWGLRSPLFLACLALAVVFLGLFVRVERRAAAPLVDLALLRAGAFVTGNLANFLSYAMLFGVFFLIPFELVRVYHDSGFRAGLRLSLVPVMLGLLAPLGGVLFDRVGPRLATGGGMLLCLGGLALLYLFLDGTPGHLTWVMAGLALFGAGQGLFVSPNTSAIMATAPPALTGEAGSLLNVVRFLGISGGIASASTVLALALSLLYGDRAGTLGASADSLVGAGRLVLLMLGGFGVLAGLLSLLRSVPRGAVREGPVEIG
ncbi:MAG: DHA2 family efflux MFS transporter permease subunit [Reyranellaceae bacterium]